MIITGVAEAIHQAKDVEDLKKVLTMLLNGLNTLSDSSIYQRGDLQFLDSTKGPVFRRDGDGHYVRVTLTGIGYTNFQFTDLGTDLPKRG